MPAIDLKIHVDKLPSVLELFDRIQIWRASSVGGVYAEITADDPAPAELVGTVTGPWNLNTKTLTLAINNADPVNIVFSGTDPIDLQSAIIKINSSGFGVIADQSAPGSGKIRLKSVTTGTGAALLASGTAATALGLPGGKVNGKGRRPILTDPTTEYDFRDLDGLATDYYKWRYYSTISFQVDAFTSPVPGLTSQVLPDNLLSVATVKLANGLGQPVEGRRIICVPVGQFQTGGYQLLPMQDRVIFTTDATGTALVKLARGGRFRVLLEGSGYEREIVIPNASTFDLFALIGAAPDPFDIVQAPPMPIRSTP